MKYRIIYLIAIVVVSTTISFGQNNMEDVLLEIAENNKTIKANQQYWATKKLSYKTGITPDNPTIEYEYLVGSPVGAGVQQDLTILQTFDFPTTYVKKKQVTELQVTQDELKQTGLRQNILLEAKQYCLELVFLNKKARVLNQRLEKMNQMNDTYQKRMSVGDATILEVNKVKLELLNVKNNLRINSSKITLYNQKLSELNGGEEILFDGSSYEEDESLPTFDVLEKNIEENDPVIKAIHEQKRIDQKKLELSKSLALPKLQGGVHYQTILGQTYQGVHVGMSIPLWESRNTVKHQKAHLIFNELEVDEHKVEHQSQIKQLYEKSLNIQIMLSEIDELYSVGDNQKLLDKALELGEISNIQYFLELSYYYNVHDQYLVLEKEDKLILAELYKYML